MPAFSTLQLFSFLQLAVLNTLEFAHLVFLCHSLAQNAFTRISLLDSFLLLVILDRALSSFVNFQAGCASRKLSLITASAELSGKSNLASAYSQRFFKRPAPTEKRLKKCAGYSADAFFIFAILSASAVSGAIRT